MILCDLALLDWYEKIWPKYLTFGSLFSLLEDFFFDLDFESFLSGGFSMPRYREKGEPELQRWKKHHISDTTNSYGQLPSLGSNDLKKIRNQCLDNHINRHKCFYHSCFQKGKESIVCKKTAFEELMCTLSHGNILRRQQIIPLVVSAELPRFPGSTMTFM